MSDSVYKTIMTQPEWTNIPWNYVRHKVYWRYGLVDERLQVPDAAKRLGMTQDGWV
jgi:hypothetical protein